MKKIISLLLVFTLVFTLFSFGTSAEDEITDYPIIIVPGYSGSALRYVDENGNEEHIWGFTGDMIMNILENTIKNIGTEKPDEEILQDAVGTDLVEWLRKMKMKDDGTSLYPLRNYYETPEEGCSARVMELHPDGQYRHEVEIQDKLAEYVGYENIFNFYNDFRYGAEYCAGKLDEYIQQVKAYTGKEKVNIYSLSHGGQVTATYLSLYGYKQDVDNAVMAIPAIGGAGIAYDLLTENLEFREEIILTFIQHGFMWEDDYDWLLKAEQLGFLDELVNDVLIPLLRDYLGNWVSLWDFIPAELYEDAKSQLLDPVKNAGLIATSDRFHYEILPNMAKNLQACESEYGMNLTIVAGSGIPVITGMSASSDSIITLASSTGATCAPYGKRFSDGYVQKNDCDGKNKVSPDMTCDLSTAYLPDDTWVIDGLYHGMVYKDDFTREIIINGVLNDKYEDVYSSPDYPQFHYTSNPSHTVHASFDSSVEGFVGEKDTKLVIENVCKEDRVKILAVEFDGCDLKVNLKNTSVLNPGESLELDVTGTLPSASKTLITATVTYISLDSITPFGQRKFSYTVTDGENAEYDGSFAEAAMPQGKTDPLAKITNPTTKTVAEFVKIFVDFISYWIKTAIVR